MASMTSVGAIAWMTNPGNAPGTGVLTLECAADKLKPRHVLAWCMVAWEAVALVGVGAVTIGAFAWNVWHHAGDVAPSPDTGADEPPARR